MTPIRPPFLPLPPPHLPPVLILMVVLILVMMLFLLLVLLATEHMRNHIRGNSAAYCTHYGMSSHIVACYSASDTAENGFTKATLAFYGLAVGAEDGWALAGTTVALVALLTVDGGWLGVAWLGVALILGWVGATALLLGIGGGSAVLLLRGSAVGGGCSVLGSLRLLAVALLVGSVVGALLGLARGVVVVLAGHGRWSLVV